MQSRKITQPGVVMQPVQHRNPYKFATGWLRPSQFRIRIRYPIQLVMSPAVVVAADELGKYSPKMLFIPDQHAVETLSAKCPYQQLNVCRRIGCAIRNCYSSDAPHTVSDNEHDVALGHPSLPIYL